MPENLKAPTNVDFYFGNTDPQEHLDIFLVAMTCQGAKDAYKCRTFPLTLKKAALRWYSRLEPNSVGCWKDLSTKFLGHFTTSKIQPKSEHHLSLIKQEKEEPLRDFLTRFNGEYLSITDIEPSVGLHLLMSITSWFLFVLKIMSINYIKWFIFENYYLRVDYFH